MTPQIALTLFILATSMLFFVTEWIPLEVFMLLVLGTVVINRLVRPAEALIDFSQLSDR